MGSVGNSLVEEISAEEARGKPESSYAYEQLTADFAKAAIKGLAGQADVFLKPSLMQKMKDAERNAARLASRLAYLAGAITADPTNFVDVSPIESYTSSDPQDMGPFLGDALEQLRIAIRFYSDFLDQIEEKDVITYSDDFEILQNHVDVEDEIETFIGQTGKSEGAKIIVPPPR